MKAKLILTLALYVWLLACIAQARHPSRLQNAYDADAISPAYGRLTDRRSPPSAQHRVYPRQRATSNLVLLKFKKIEPIALILLRSSDQNEAELVPVYPISEIPAGVHFKPTPNGIAGHRDVQAIAIPSELHEQLNLNGLANLAGIETLLNQAESVGAASPEEQKEDGETEDKPVAVINEQSDPEDEPLNVYEEGADQLLNNLSSNKTETASPSAQSARRSATERAVVVITHQQAGMAAVPPFLYVAHNTEHRHHSARKVGRKGVRNTQSRFHA